jgi:hypothetical protein
MKKVNIEKSVSLVGLNDLVNRGIIDKFDYECVKEFVKDNGDGIIELVFGCRGVLEEINKSDEYLSVEEVKEEFYDNEVDIEEVLEFYCDNGNNNYWDDEGKIEYIFCVDYIEEGWSMFINING